MCTVGGTHKQVFELPPQWKQNDIIGCYIDLLLPEIRFSYNGTLVPGAITNFSITGLVFPVVTMSPNVR